MRWLILLLLVVAACDRWDDDSAALWKMPAHRLGFPDLPASLYAATTPGQDTVVAVVDARVGDRNLPGPHVVRIDPDGAITHASAVTEISLSAVMAAATDDQGRLVAAWGSPNGVSWIVAFAEDLSPRWKLDTTGFPGYACCLDLEHGLFDVGPQGQVAFAQMNANGEQTLHYIGENGIERWAAPASGAGYASHLRIATDGDLLAYPAGRFAAADGSRSTGLPSARASTRSGVSLSLDFNQLTLREPSGAIRWEQTINGIGFCPFGGCGREPSARSAVVSLTPSEDVLVQLYQTQHQLLDGGSGDRGGSYDHCGSPAILAVDDAGYLALGPFCGSDQGLAKYPLPD